MAARTRPIDAAWLAALRIGLGVVLGVSMLRFVAYGWVERFFVAPRFHFKYFGFEWVEPLASSSAMNNVFLALALLAFCTAAGVCYRVSSALFALGLFYVQLLDVTTYLNHYYLAALLALLLSVTPAHRVWSVDAWISRRLRPGARPTTVAAGVLYLFRFQVGLVYVFAALAKLQPDWLLHAQPLRIWLGASVDLPLIGPLLRLPFVPLAMSWAGFLFDATIVGWLLWTRSRPFAYVAVIAFHLLTRALLPIGMFPAIMIVSALVFFTPSWPRRAFAVAARVPLIAALVQRVRRLAMRGLASERAAVGAIDIAANGRVSDSAVRSHQRAADGSMSERGSVDANRQASDGLVSERTSANSQPVAADAWASERDSVDPYGHASDRLGSKRALARSHQRAAGELVSERAVARPHRFALWVGVAYCAVQLLLPLRTFAYGGNPNWHEQGMRFAWRVMVRAKGGSTTFVVHDRSTGRTFHVSPREYLTDLQESEMSSQPDLILQMAHHIRRDLERRGLGPLEVRVQARASLNGRPSVPLIDPVVDLSRVADGFGYAAWILPAPQTPAPHTRLVP